MYVVEGDAPIVVFSVGIWKGKDEGEGLLRSEGRKDGRTDGRKKERKEGHTEEARKDEGYSEEGGKE